MVYSTYEAKARFSEILRRVRRGESVSVTYRGRTVAEIRPAAEEETDEARLERLERTGVLQAPAADEVSAESLKPLAPLRLKSRRSPFQL